MGIVSWNDPATRWIDGLSTVRRLLVWAGISLAAAFTVCWWGISALVVSSAGRGPLSLGS
jgi:hypothetical protein